MVPSMRLRLTPSIANAIFALAGLLIALMAIVATINSTMSVRVGELIGTINRTYVPVYGMLARAHIRSLEQSLALRQAALGSLSGASDIIADQLAAEAKANEGVAQELAAARDAIAAQAATSSGIDDRVLLGRLEAQVEAASRIRTTYDRQRAELITALQARDTPSILRGLERLDVTRTEQNERLENTRRESLAFAAKAVEATQASGREVIRLTLLMLGIAILLGALMAFYIARRMVGSIRQLVQATEAAEQGRYDAELPVTSQDEIGRLTRAFNLMLAELRLKQKIRDTFGRYMDPKVVSGLLDRPELSGVAGERRVMTIMFADMRGFTHLSEEVTPAVLVTVLNRYLTVLTEEIRERQGIVDKYMGDGVMAFWGPPFVDPDQQARLACAAALAQLGRFEAFRKEMPELLGIRKYVPDVGIRIGIATGEVIAGNVGSAVTMNYTVMGDAVNVASRLEGLNKLYGTAILITEGTAAMAGPDAVLREIDRVTVQGRDIPMSVFELMGEAGSVEKPTLQLVERYGEGLAAYRARDWTHAMAAFQDCLALRPDDQPSAVMLSRTEAFATSPPPEGWDAVWHASK